MAWSQAIFLGTIAPVVKNSNGDINLADNYRGVTLCSVFSHMFENALRLKFGHFLKSHDLQFGFKAKHSTNHAVFTLKSCIDYFTKRDSNVYVAFLDLPLPSAIVPLADFIAEKEISLPTSNLPGT